MRDWFFCSRRTTYPRGIYHGKYESCRSYACSLCTSYTRYAMQVTPLTDIPARPEPIFDNTDVRGVDFSVRRVLDTPILFEEETTFVRRPIQV